MQSKISGSEFEQLKVSGIKYTRKIKMIEYTIFIVSCIVYTIFYCLCITCTHAQVLLHGISSIQVPALMYGARGGITGMHVEYASSENVDVEYTSVLCMWSIHQWYACGLKVSGVQMEYVHQCSACGVCLSVLHVECVTMFCMVSIHRRNVREVGY